MPDGFNGWIGHVERMDAKENNGIKILWKKNKRQTEKQMDGRNWKGLVEGGKEKYKARAKNKVIR